MKKGKGDSEKASAGGAGKSEEADFFLSVQGSDVNKKIVGQEKTKVDKSILFFLSDFPMLDGCSE